MRRLLRILLWTLAGLALVLLVASASLVVAVYWNGRSSDGPPESGVVAGRLASPSVEARVARRARAAHDLGLSAQKQILFGDLHVHTSHSTDALVQGLPALGGEGIHTPTDACDFARFCAGLDFWSINDHAESITPAGWADTREAIRRCNQAAGDPANPDLVSFLGWEWSQMGTSAESHFGHKNVVLLGTDDDETPARPIAAPSYGAIAWNAIGLALSVADWQHFGEYADLHRAILDELGRTRCAAGVDVRALPIDCYEQADTPDVLFEKLDQWGFPALVIPHGLAWGTTNPVDVDLARQLGAGMHDPERQRLIEIYSGHGSSEVYSDFAREHVDESTRIVCPEPGPDFEPCCWRAGEIVRARCADPQSRECAYQVDEARVRGAGVGGFLSPTGAVLGSTIEEFGDCGQLRGSFLPAFNYRPGGSAQYGIALGAFEGDGPPERFRFGFIGSSDNHRARAGSGYKEFGRLAMTDGTPIGGDWRDVRSSSFYYTGGLVAVHAAGRDRQSIFDALARREVYATSGDRILLWFALVRPDGRREPMGSEVRVSGVPQFEVRAAGALEELPGCPAEVEGTLTPERLRRLCLGECHHPGDTRKEIERIEVVRIRPQVSRGEGVGPLIEDPWRVFPCAPDPGGCRVAFEDPELPGSGREAVYYVRAIERATPAVNGDPLRCERDDEGRCIRSRPCRGGGSEGGSVDDCVADVEERAWSSPIFVQPEGEAPVD